jgi:hypothetical protein
MRTPVADEDKSSAAVGATVGLMLSGSIMVEEAPGDC